MNSEKVKPSLKKTKKISPDKRKGVKELTKKRKIIKEGKTGEEKGKKEKKLKKPSITPFEETTIKSSEPGKGVKPLSKKKVNRRHRPSKLKKQVLHKTSKKKIFPSVESAEKTLLKKVENLKELRAKRKNKLFCLFKKKVSDELQIKALHPDIKSVKFPRKKNPKYCWISFATPRKANEAFEALKDNPDYSIEKPKTNVSIDVKSKAKELYEKAQKKLKKKAMVKNWSKAN